MATEIGQLEEELASVRAKLAEARRRAPKEEVSHYVFKGPGGTDVALEALFGDKPDLLVIHSMGKGCRFCTLWADGFNGVRDHLEDRAAFVVVSPDDPQDQAAFAAERGWKFRMVSARGTTFFKDMGFQREKGGAMPGVSAFRRGEDGRIYRVAHTRFGPGDDFCSVWHLFALLADGAGEWQPKFRY